MDVAPLGFACASSAACSSGLCIAETRSGTNVSWSAGYCSQACDASNACPVTAECVAFEDGSSLCLARCATAADCRAGYICSSAVEACLPDCRLGFSCGTALACDTATGNCVVPQGTQSIGGTCKLNTDCKSVLCTPEQSTASGKQWLDGYCTQACSSTAPCDDGALCITYADGTAYCAAGCKASSDCRNGYVCSAGACLPDCRQGFGCGDVLVCDAASGACVGKMQPVGAACTANVDCASGLCTPAQTTSQGVAWAGGYCTEPCSAAAACPAAATCLTYADGSSYCIGACAADADCRAGYVCATSVGGCLPDCRQGFSCGDTLTCSATTGTCG